MPSRFARLALQRSNLASNFPQNIGQSQKIRLCSLKLSFRLSFLDFETHHPGSFFKDCSAILWFGGENLVNLPLLHDRVGCAADTGI